MGHSIPSNLLLLRSQLRSKRKQLTTEFCVAASEIIVNKIIHHEIFIQSTNIAGYLAAENEVDLSSLMALISQHNKKFYLPIFCSRQNPTLTFVKYSRGDDLVLTRYGVQEPKADQQNNIKLEDLDLVIVPLVGFNREGYRIGRGAGCYDQTFAFKRVHPEGKPFLLGVGYGFQCVDFRAQNWDVKMDQIITEK